MAVPVFAPEMPIYEGGTVSAATLAATPGYGSATPAPAPGALPTFTPTGKRIRVVDPTGKPYSIDSGELEHAQSKGWKVETPEATALREFLAENKGLSGAATVAFAGLINEASLGVSGAIIDHTLDDASSKRWAALKQEHNAANWIGSIGGFGLSLLYGGEFFKGAAAAGRVAEGAILGGRAVERAVVAGVEHVAASAAEKAAAKVTTEAVAETVAERLIAAGVPAAEAARAAPSLVRRLAASTGKLAAEGAVLVAPKAATEAMFGDHEKAAETMLWGIGGAAALGAAGGAAGELYSAAKGAFEGAIGKIGSGAKIQELAASTAKEAAWRDLGGIKRYAKTANGFPGRPGIPGKTAGVGEQLIEDGLLRQPGEGHAEYAARIHEGPEGAQSVVATGKRIGALWKDSGATVPIEELDAALGAPLKELKGHWLGEPEVAALTEMGDSLLGRAQGLDADGLKELQALKKDLAKAESAVERVRVQREELLANPSPGEFLGGRERVAPYAKLTKRLEQYEARLAERQEHLSAFTQGMATEVGVDKLHAFRTDLQKELAKHWTPTDIPDSPLVGQMKKLRGTLTEVMEGAASKLDPTFSERLAAENLRYRRLMLAEKAAAVHASALDANQRLGLTDKIVGATGAVLGHGLGGLPGLATGAAMAYANRYIRREGDRILAKAADGVAKGRGMSGLIGAHQELAAKLEAVPRILGSLGERIPAASRETLPAHVLSRLLSPDGRSDHVGGDKTAVFTEFADKLATLSSDPTRMQAHIAALMPPDLAQDAPQIAANMAMKETARLQYLQSQIPKPAAQASPFAPQTWKPNDAEYADFAIKASVAYHPLEVFDRLKDRTLRRTHMDALDAVWPKLAESFRAQILKFAATNKAQAVKYADLNALSVALGMPLAPSLANVDAYQATFADDEEESKSGDIDPKKLPDQSTDVSRVLDRRT